MKTSRTSKRPFIDPKSIVRQSINVVQKRDEIECVQVPKNQNKQRINISTRSDLKLPVARIKRFMKMKQYAPIIRTKSAIFLAAVTEYCLRELLKSASDHTRSIDKKIIQPRNVMFALKGDVEFSKAFGNVIIPGAGRIPDPKFFRKKKIKVTCDMPKKTKLTARKAQQKKTHKKTNKQKKKLTAHL